MNVFFFQAEDGIRDGHVTGVQTCALPIYSHSTCVQTDRARFLRDPFVHTLNVSRGWIEDRKVFAFTNSREPAPNPLISDRRSFHFRKRLLRGDAARRRKQSGPVKPL